jgi:hypothetical protein
VASVALAWCLGPSTHSLLPTTLFLHGGKEGLGLGTTGRREKRLGVRNDERARHRRHIVRYSVYDEIPVHHRRISRVKPVLCWQHSNGVNIACDSDQRGHTGTNACTTATGTLFE